jgi:hypothetical protein
MRALPHTRRRPGETPAERSPYRNDHRRDRTDPRHAPRSQELNIATPRMPEPIIRARSKRTFSRTILAACGRLSITGRLDPTIANVGDRRNRGADIAPWRDSLRAFMSSQVGWCRERDSRSSIPAPTVPSRLVPFRAEPQPYGFPEVPPDTGELRRVRDNVVTTHRRRCSARCGWSRAATSVWVPEQAQVQFHDLRHTSRDAHRARRGRARSPPPARPSPGKSPTSHPQ